MATKQFLDGNLAIAYAVMTAKAEVVAAYPITPQTVIVEKISELIADGLLDAEFIKVESEHSALSSSMGASSTGIRTFTATSSQGLAYMHEMLHYVSGARLPVVMGLVNRALAPPWNIWCDHQDSVSARDTGWLQLYVETAQEAFDTVVQAFRIAEDPKVMTPTMVCMDAFVLSHTNEIVMVEDIDDIQKYLPAYHPEYYISADSPLTMSAGATPEYYMEYRERQQRALEYAKEIIYNADSEYGKFFGRSYGGMVDAYKLEDAEAVLLMLGSIAGTVRDVIDEMRADGKKVGMLRIRAFRPFPCEEIRRHLANVKSVGVLDRDISFGYEGALGSEVKAALYSQGKIPKVVNYIVGLGGRDITSTNIRQMFEKLLSEGETYLNKNVEFVGLRC